MIETVDEIVAGRRIQIDQHDHDLLFGNGAAIGKDEIFYTRNIVARENTRMDPVKLAFDVDPVALVAVEERQIMRCPVAGEANVARRDARAEIDRIGRGPIEVALEIEDHILAVAEIEAINVVVAAALEPVIAGAALDVVGVLGPGNRR